MKLKRRTQKPVHALAAARQQRKARRRRRRLRLGRQPELPRGPTPRLERPPPPGLRWQLIAENEGLDESPESLGVESLMMTPEPRDLGVPDDDELAEADASMGVETPAHLTEQIRDLEARLERMLGRDDERGADDLIPPSIREQVGSAARDVVERLAAPLPTLERPGRDDGTVADAARELLSSDYYLRQWGRIGMRNRSEEVDEFGYDPTYEARLMPILDFLYRRYFRVEAEGLEQIPAEGRCLIVANHSGTIPLDGVMLRMAVSREHSSARAVRWLAEDFLYYLPFAGSRITRLGAVRACQENAERLLRQGAAVAAFPEGIKGISKLFKERYRLQRFGRGGVVRLCLRTHTPLVPCAIIGAEETGPMLHRLEHLGRLVGLPYIPVTPTFPLLGPLGLLPAPIKWRVVFGSPVDLGTAGEDAADDEVLVGRLTERVRANIQSLLDEALQSRQSVWLG